MTQKKNYFSSFYFLIILEDEHTISISLESMVEKYSLEISNMLETNFYLHMFIKEKGGHELPCLYIYIYIYTHTHKYILHDV